VFGFAKPGHIYAVYLPPSFEATAEVWLPAAEYTVRWYDPRSGGTLQAGSVTRVAGPGFRSLGAPPGDSGDDWVALVELSGPPPEEIPPPPRS
jgi:hypothetical protein